VIFLTSVPPILRLFIVIPLILGTVALIVQNFPEPLRNENGKIRIGKIILCLILFELVWLWPCYIFY